jgi:hypothetical protein
MAEANESPNNEAEEKKAAPDAASQRRAIPGNLPYLTSHGTLKRILDRVIELAKPDKFNHDYLENYVKITGGAARACIPIMKKMGFLNSDNTTTDLYGKFRTDGGRSLAAYTALQNAFPEIFRRSDYAHSVEDSKLRDIIVEITGLKTTDVVAKAIKGTFEVVKSYIQSGFNPNSSENAVSGISEQEEPAEIVNQAEAPASKIGLSYNINVVIPETSDINVLNAIFRSIKENLLK